MNDEVVGSKNYKNNRQITSDSEFDEVNLEVFTDVTTRNSVPKSNRNAV